MNNLIKNLAIFTGISFSIFLLSFIVLAWDGPQTSPPTGNTPKPINAGTVGTSQRIEGALNVGGVLVGDTGVIPNATEQTIPTCNSSTEGMQWYDYNSKVLLLCNGTTWGAAGSNLCAELPQGGEWIDSGLGFCVMKYEAKEVGGLATSTPTGNPWININQDQARTACQAIGAQLITNAQWTALARNIETTASNWSDGIVGSGVLARGWAAHVSYGDSWTNTNVASSTGPSCLYNDGADICSSTGNHLYKRTHTLSNGETIWDLSGNVWEWNNDTCSQTNWYSGAAWIEWDNDALSDYEKTNAGSLGNYTSANGAGRYYGCIANGNGFLRGGNWNYGDYAGVITLGLGDAPADLITSVGFRCTVTP